MMKENKFHKLNMKKKEDSCQFTTFVFPPLSWLSNFSALFLFYFIFHLLTYIIYILQLVEEVSMSQS